LLSLTSKNIILFILVNIILFGLSGCSKRTYSTNTYDTKYETLDNSHEDKKIQKVSEKIRDSKAMHRATMRPYTVFGKKYYPTTVRIGEKYTGIASWYGPNFHNKKTSNGEIYNMHASTAAHKTLPMNTMVKVSNIVNGTSTIVRINDRGPFIGTRIIDLSNKAAHEIDMVKKGTVKVKLEIIGFHGKIAKTKSQLDEIMSIGKYYLQVGAFSKYAGVKITQRKFKNLIDDKYNIVIKKDYVDNKALNRVWISGFRSENETSTFKEENGLYGAMIIAQ
jgi:rare lipoprotein A